MPGFLNTFVEHKPEWSAAAALLIQAFILILQWRILKRHAVTMEEHTEIAGTQAKALELIGQALQQQGKILDDQVKIMAEQFKFSKQLEAADERTRVFDLVLTLRSRIWLLTSTLSKIQPSNYNADASRAVKQGFDDLALAILPCQKALLTSVHLSKTEKEYFMRYSQDVDNLKMANDPNKDFAALNQLNAKYKDFDQMMLKMAQSELAKQ